MSAMAPADERALLWTAAAPRRRRSATGARAWKVSPTVVRDTVRIADALILTQASALASRALLRLLTPGAASDADLAFCIAAGAVALTVLSLRGVYEVTSLRRPGAQLVLFAGAIATGAAAALYLAFALGAGSPGLGAWLAMWSACAFALLLAFRALLLPMLNAWAATGQIAKGLAVVGVNEVSRRFVEHLAAQPAGEVQLAGVYRERNGTSPLLHAGAVVRGGVDDLIRETRAGGIDAIVIALPRASAELASEISRRLKICVADIQVLPDLGDVADASPDAGPLLTIAERPLKGWKRLQKEAFDRLLAALLVLLLAPLMLLIAVLVRCESRGPSLFRQQRMGFNNVPFTILKFRTMYTDRTDADSAVQTSRRDPRVTRVGHWLRRTSLDEFPQLLNVLRGEMSLVGPRPHARLTHAGGRLLDEVVAEYAHRHRVKPGITGWAQVNGLRGEIRNATHIQSRVEHDLWYIDHWSLLFDLRILFLTLKNEFITRNAY